MLEICFLLQKSQPLSRYDAAIGCPEGEMLVTPATYPHLLHQVVFHSSNPPIIKLKSHRPKYPKLCSFILTFFISFQALDVVVLLPFWREVTA